ncbi:MAG: sugar phosphate isomerase/epimerase [Planctomycetes bacterium]|nr:sugar phosphate isomerase/epimerase [Planctomycetota bacterium]
MLLGYNTNGFAHHRLEGALAILAELGYRSVAITLDHHALNPFEGDLPAQVEKVRRLLETLNLRCVVETGARYLLDPRCKHQPTLIGPTEEERERRLLFICHAIVIARELRADAVSFWSGTATDEAAESVLMDRLVHGCLRLCDFAETREVRLAFEPEPGMFIDTMDRFANLYERMRSPRFGLTLDIGHLHCQGEPIADNIRKWSEIIWNVHIEDMRRGVHDHLMFGDGEIDFGPVFAALKEIQFQGGVHVELSRHSHDAVNTARKALAFLETWT